MNDPLDDRIDRLLLAFARVDEAREAAPLEDLDVFIAGRADSATAARFERWLAADPEAADFIEEYRRLQAVDVVAELRPEVRRAARGVLADRGSGSAWIPKPPWRPRGVMSATVALTLIAAAVGLSGVLQTQTTGAPNFGEPMVIGGLARDRSASSVPDIRRTFVSDSSIVVEFGPVPRTPEARAALLLVFSVDRDERLIRLDPTVTTVLSSGQLTVRAEQPVEALDVRDDGTANVVFVFVPENVPAAEIEAAALEELLARDDVTAVLRTFRVVDDLRTATLYGYDWIVADGATLTYGFWDGTEAIIHVAGPVAADWVIELSGETGAPTVELEYKASVTDGGTRFTVELPSARDDRGTLGLRSGTGRIITQWRVSRRTIHPTVDAVRALEATDRAEHGLDRLEQALDDADSWDELWLRTELGKTEFRMSRWDRARVEWQRAVELARTLHVVTEEAARLRSLAFLEIETGSFVDARALLGEAHDLAAQVGDEAGVARGIYLEASLDQRASAPRAYVRARARYTAALQSAVRRGDDRDARLFAGMLATLFVEEGKPSEAQEILLTYAPPADAAPAELVQHGLRVAYAQAVLEEARAPVSEGAARWLPLIADAERLLTMAKDHGTAVEAAYLMTHLAQLNANADRLDDAQRWIDEARSNPRAAAHAARWELQLVTLEVAIRRSPSPAVEPRIAALRRTALTANGGLESDTTVLTSMLLGDLHRALGDDERAIQDYAQADTEAEHIAARFVAPSTGGLYRRRRARGHERHIALLLAQGRAASAFQVVERRRWSAFRQLRAQLHVAERGDAWKRYGDAYRTVAQECGRRDAGACKLARVEFDRAFSALQTISDRAPPTAVDEVARRLEPREALLSLSRIEDETVGFLVADGEISVLAGPDSGARLLEGLTDVDRLYVTSDDDAAATAAFTHIMDKTAITASRLPHAGFLRTPSEVGGPWLVVADPDDTLLHARGEGKRIAALRTGTVIPLIGSKATRTAVLDALGRVDVLHFAGHGPPSDTQASSDVMPLADGDTLTSEDILGLAHGPRLVVLSGCRTGRDLGPLIAGLPEAFLSAGADVVIAAVGVVPDDAAARFTERFYSAGGREKPIAAFHRVGRAMLSEGDDTWRRFRVWGVGM